MPDKLIGIISKSIQRLDKLDCANFAEANKKMEGSEEYRSDIDHLYIVAIAISELRMDLRYALKEFERRSHELADWK